ncbi:unnamed protein product [Darwinula stevensoni]|uniref:Uncharacterized protein n=1 Tax=Darwinula stevensoni TaxID=69355 RepID=A0A7R9AB38_9CRUS|nr:unnamed protein product [Darwinula stevensoni]CAG0899054.1 unnamed protein product [Darwinula stevensoni]
MYRDALLGREAVALGLDDTLLALRSNEAKYLKVQEQLQKDMLKVEIFFRSLNIQVIQEQPKYDLNGLVSSLGGVFGIYLGMCAVMFIEVVEFLALLLCDIALHYLGRGPRDGEEQEENGRRPRSKQRDAGKRRAVSVSPMSDSVNRMASLYPVAPTLPLPVYYSDTEFSRIEK